MEQVIVSLPSTPISISYFRIDKKEGGREPPPYTLLRYTDKNATA
jgi:hypothetical protein